MGWKKCLVPKAVFWGKEKQMEGSAVVDLYGVTYPTPVFWDADGRIGSESVLD